MTKTGRTKRRTRRLPVTVEYFNIPLSVVNRISKIMFGVWGDDHMSFNFDLIY